jgi:predicted nucleic acid-binding protein
MIFEGNTRMVGVDTQIFIYAYKIPESATKAETERHKKCSSLLSDAAKNNSIAIASHELAEIFHALAFRGSRIKTVEAVDRVNTILHSKAFVVISSNTEILTDALSLSSESGIHIWDFLCFLPIKSFIHTFYTTDSHFRHTCFDEFDVKIVNPLNQWDKL